MSKYLLGILFTTLLIGCDKKETIVPNTPIKKETTVIKKKTATDGVDIITNKTKNPAELPEKEVKNDSKIQPTLPDGVGFKPGDGESKKTKRNSGIGKN